MHRLHVLAALSFVGLVAHAAVLRAQTFVESAQALGIEHTWGNMDVNGDVGGGVALGDFDGDLDLDVLLGTAFDEPLAIFLNESGHFTAHVDDTFPVMGEKQILFADLDDDGRQDLVVLGWQPDGAGARFSPYVFRNLGQGAYEDRTQGSGLAERTIDDARLLVLAAAAAVADVDRDGDLDLYVSYWKAGPPAPISANVLYRNDGDFTFVDVTTEAGVGNEKKSYQPVFTDLNLDDWPDLVVPHDKAGGASYYENDGTGKFVDRSVASGLDGFVPATQTLVDGMGTTVGDYDGDGWFDVYITNIPDGNVLYRNLGGGQFEERAQSARVFNQRFAWGCGFDDFNLDGWLDLYVVNSSTDDRNRLYRNQGNGTFSDVGIAAGISDSGFSWASATGDLDDDGDLDLVVSQGLEFPTVVYLNQGVDAHWLHFELEGVESNRDAIGARIRVTAGTRSQLVETRAGTSYMGFDSPRVEFGLGNRDQADEVEVWWPSGHLDRFTDVAADRVYDLREGGDLLPRGDATPSRTRLSRAVPNPFNPNVGFDLEVPREAVGAPAVVAIFDLRGRLVAALFFGPIPGTLTSFVWDGRFHDGTRAPSGTYLIHAQVGSTVLTRGIRLVR